YHNQLYAVLRDAGLTQDVGDKADAGKLLQHYRNLAGLLDPTPILETVIKDAANLVTHTETYYPVTKKTDAQKIALAGYRNSAAYANQHKAVGANCATAFQQATAAFIDYLTDDTRRLPAEADYLTEHTVKNGWVCRYTLVHNGEQKTAWFVRHATLPYVYRQAGVNVEDAVAENIQQIRETVKKEQSLHGTVALHFVLLNTNTRINRQDVMVKKTQHAVEQEEENYFSNVPINLQGVLYQAIVSPIVGELPRSRFDRYDRVHKAADVVELTIDKNKAAGETVYIACVACQHGLDRTGTIVELSLEKFAAKVYQEFGISISREEIEWLRVRAGHAGMV
ncbi:MAG TPA: hypothetical protein VI522_03120, partial [Gammaproteobacteria bacterium]|nr:hypothetical protein [Gammaproteobacteria bacterium]